MRYKIFYAELAFHDFSTHTKYRFTVFFHVSRKKRDFYIRKLQVALSLISNSCLLLVSSLPRSTYLPRDDPFSLGKVKSKTKIFHLHDDQSVNWILTSQFTVLITPDFPSDTPYKRFSWQVFVLNSISDHLFARFTRLHNIKPPFNTVETRMYYIILRF